MTGTFLTFGYFYNQGGSTSFQIAPPIMPFGFKTITFVSTAAVFIYNNRSAQFPNFTAQATYNNARFVVPSSETFSNGAIIMFQLTGTFTFTY